MRAEQEIRRHTAQLEALRQAGLELTAQLDLDALLHSTASQAIALVGGTSSDFYLYRPERDVLEWVMAVGPELAPIRTILHRGEGLSGKVWETGQPLIVDDYQRWDGRLAMHEGHPLRAAVGVPVQWEEEFLGVLNILADAPCAFSHADAELLSFFAQQAAIAIRNACLYAKSQRRVLEQETVSRIAYALNTPDVRDAFPTLVEGLQDLTGCEMVSLMAIDETGEQFITTVLESPFPIPWEGEVMLLSATAAAEDIETGRPHLTADLSTETHFPFEQTLYQIGLRSLVTLPLLVGGEVFGALSLGSSRTDSFREDQLPVLRQVADVLALALENSFLFLAERERRELAKALEEATAALTATLDFDQVLDRILEQVSRVVPNDAANIMLIKGDRARVVRWRGYERFGAEQFVSTVVFRIPEMANLQQMLDSREPLVIPDIADYPDWVCVPATKWLRSYAAAPIIVRDEVIGFLNVDSATPGFFGQEHAESLRVFADHAAAAIENARLYEAEQKRRRLADTLRQVATVLSSTLDLKQVLDLILEHLAQVVPYDSASVMLVSDDVLRVVAARGFPDIERTMQVALPVAEDALFQEMLRTRQPVILTDAQKDKRFVAAGDTGYVRGWIGAPLVVKGQVIGNLTVDSRMPGAYGQEEAEMVAAFANQAAIAIENARLYEETRRHATELGILFEVVTAGMTSVRLDEILDRVMTALQETLRPDSIAILLVERETNELVIRAHTGFPGGPKLVRRPIGVGIPSWVVQTGQPVLLTDVREDERYYACDPNTRSELCVPLRVGERIIGALNLESHRLSAFNEDDLRLLSILAGHLAVVVENARLFEEIEERRLYLEGVLGSAPDAIVALDAQHRIVEWNAGAEKLFGYSREEVIGRDLDPLITNPETIQQASEFRQIVMSGRDLPPVETVRYRKDGSPVHVIVAASPILVGGELIGAVAVYTDITVRKRTEDMLRALLLIDELTGLYNRRGFLTLGQQQLKMANRTRRRMYLLFTDFDDLKWINDTFGHPEGDRALIEVANVLRKTFRESDIIARIGGDEFVVLAMETGGAGADVLAARLQENLRVCNAREGRCYKLSLSIGVARYDPENPCSIDELIAEADKLMYEQKWRNQRCLLE